ncbi:MAG: hypothetical protein J1F02_06775 [Lachnospiraceae bacterium]|nr:hypothetical protein [Lachnospiraceae bacterium]
MAYKIAVASSDGISVDLHFGAASEFRIYQMEDGEYSLLEQRAVEESEEITGGRGGAGCGGGALQKVEQIGDCRCVVCRKIGFQMQKQLEKKAIPYFDVSCTVEEALGKIMIYFDRIDKRQSLRGLSGR